MFEMWRGILCLACFVFIEYQCLSIASASTEDSNTQCSIVQTELLDMSSRFNSLEAKYSSLEVKYSSLEVKYSSLELKYDIYTEDRQQMFKYFDVISEALKRLMRIEAENDLLKQSVQTLQNEREEMTQEIENLKQNIESVKNQQNDDNNTLYTILEDINQTIDGVENQHNHDNDTIHTILQVVESRIENHTALLRNCNCDLNVTTSQQFENNHTDVTNGSEQRTDCKDWYDNGATKNGVYEISPKAKTTFRAYCDMSNGGWTVIQRRENGNVSFDHNWEKYAEGFGEPSGDHWLGLRYLHDLTDGSPSQIHFRFLMTETQAYATAIYPGFYVENEAAKFRMHVDPNVTYNTEMQKYVDSQYKFFLFHNNMKFSTKEQDNDNYVGNCARSYGGFWFNECYTINVNTDFSKMRLWSSKSGSKKVSRSEIKIRLVF